MHFAAQSGVSTRGLFDTVERGHSVRVGERCPPIYSVKATPKDDADAGVGEKTKVAHPLFASEA